MTAKLTTTITAAALAALAAFAETNAPSAKSDETAALKARVEKLEKDLATLRAQFIGIEPIVTNENGEAAFFEPRQLINRDGYRIFFKFRNNEISNGNHIAFITFEKTREERWRKFREELDKRNAARTNSLNRVTSSPQSHSSAESADRQH